MPRCVRLDAEGWCILFTQVDLWPPAVSQASTARVDMNTVGLITHLYRRNLFDKPGVTKLWCIVVPRVTKLVCSGATCHQAGV